MSNRVAKKITTPFQKFAPNAAVLVINMIDPQVSTMKVFLEAISTAKIPFIAIANKMDVVKKTKLAEIEKTLGLKLTPTSTAKGTGIKKLVTQIEKTFKKGSKIVVLGVFNSGKTSLISCLTGNDLEIGDLPGTTSEFTKHKWGNYTLIDTVGQLIDISKPMMVSVDLSDCKTLDNKIERILRQDAEGILATLEIAVPSIKKGVKILKKQIKAGKKIIVTGAGASALVAMEMAGQGMETGLPILVATNNLAEAQPVSFSKGIAEEEGALARYINFMVNQGDVVIGISASGGTGFVYDTLKRAKKKKAITIAITENSDTPMGKAANLIIKSNAKPEGPSSSKIQVAHLAIGHALIIALADEQGITADGSISYMLPEKVLTKKMGIK
ncbi:SIS domain-containing protein [Patescibacteria group bacterium]|nr:SIS domain-containing protein [Patescibacteria group bacterium]MBU1256803.1 SIS domain-containing protein [Patescibacteria group bacterium]MBU1457354.1 SIS domain-containing protein [Patescibacteria group bacterium]